MGRCSECRNDPCACVGPTRTAETSRDDIPRGPMQFRELSEEEKRVERGARFRARSTADLMAEKWEQFPHLGLERVRVLGGWLYRPIVAAGQRVSCSCRDYPACGHATPEAPAPLTFVPDPPRYVYTGGTPPGYPR